MSFPVLSFMLLAAQSFDVGIVLPLLLCPIDFSFLLCCFVSYSKKRTNTK